MKRSALRLLLLLSALLMVAACSDNGGQYGIEPTPYTDETARIDPALQPNQPTNPPTLPARTDMPDDTTTSTSQ